MSRGEDIVEGALCRIEDGHCTLKVSVEITIKSYRALNTYIRSKAEMQGLAQFANR